MKCNLCDSDEFELLFRNYDRMYGIEDYYNIAKCKNCGLISVNPQPTQRQLEKHYPEEKYYSLEKSSTNSDMKNTLQRTYYAESSEFLKLLFMPFRPFINSIKIVKNGKFLDIGCGSGDLLELISHLGMDCYGVEPGKFNKKLAEKRGLKIFNGNLEKAGYRDNYFDVIIMNHVLEHVSNPLEILSEIKRILKPDGTVIIGTPVTDSLAFAMFRKKWLALDTPRHLFLFSKNNLRAYAEKAGFSVEKIRYNSSPLQFVGSLLYSSNSFKKNPIAFDDFIKKKYLVSSLYALFTPFSHICNLFKLGDQVEIFLKPKNE